MQPIDHRVDRVDRIDRIARRLKFKDLHTFRAAVQLGSMSKAAAEVALTPPAVTKVIGDMERLLGVKLLERTSQGVAPTAYGEALLSGSLNLFDDLRRTIEQIEFLADPTVGEVRVNWSAAWHASVLPMVIDRVSRQYPRIVMHFSTSSSAHEQLKALQDRAFDLCFNRLEAQPEEVLEQEALFDDPMVIVTSRDNTRLRGRNITLAQLMDAAWCLPSGSTMATGHLARAFQSAGLSFPHISVHCLSMELQTALVASGRFLTVLPASYLRFSAVKASLRILPVALGIDPPPVGIVTLKNRALSPVANLFVQTLRAVVKDAKLSRAGIGTAALRNARA